MPNASGASNVRTTAPSPSFGRGRCGSSTSTERFSQRTNVCSHTGKSEPSVLRRGLLAPREPQLLGVLRERVDHELQVLVEAHPALGLELLGAPVDVIAVDAGGEARLLELL